jgi:hypothetical protein
MLVISLGAIGVGILGMRALAKRQGLGGPGATDMTGFEFSSSQQGA